MRPQGLQRDRSPPEANSQQNCVYIAPSRLRGRTEAISSSGASRCSNLTAPAGERLIRQGQQYSGMIIHASHSTCLVATCTIASRYVASISSHQPTEGGTPSGQVDSICNGLLLG